jgi:hypothetical protein
VIKETFAAAADFIVAQKGIVGRPWFGLTGAVT